MILSKGPHQNGTRNLGKTHMKQGIGRIVAQVLVLVLEVETMFAKETVAVMVTVVTNGNSCHHKITIFEGHR